MTTAELFVKCLEKEGVRYVFGLPGEEIEDLLFALKKSSIRFVPTRHEQGAAFMADVWGRLTGRAGVCIATLGPGATNLITGVADANMDKSPLVAITGQGGTERAHHESHQYLDVLALFKPVTKWNAAVTSPASVPEIVRKAFKTAEGEKPGAVHIEIAEDVAKMKCSGLRPLPSARVRRPEPDRQALAEAVSFIKRSKRPLIIAGNGAVRKDVSREVAALVEAHRIPLVNTFMGQGALPDTSEYSLFTIGMGFRDIVMDAVDRSDLVISVGYDIAEYAPNKWNPKRNKRIIHVDYAPAEVYTHYQPAVEIVADIRATLKALNRRLGKPAGAARKPWHSAVRRRILHDIRSYDLKRPKAPFTIPGALNILRSVMNDDDLLISDVGSHKMWIARNFPVNHPNGCLISNGLASMGFAVPGAVAAALAAPGRRVVAATGDGGFLMNSQELETAKRLGVAFTTVIFNDNDYGLISWKQKSNRGATAGTRITNPDFKKYAESFGIRGYSPKTLPELKDQLKEAVASRVLSVVEIVVDPQVNLELSKKVRGHELD